MHKINKTAVGLLRRYATFFTEKTHYPLSRLRRQLPQGDAFWQCRKVSTATKAVPLDRLSPVGERCRAATEWGTGGIAVGDDGRGIPGKHTLHFSRKLYRYAKGSPFGRAGIEQGEMTERASPLK